MTTREALGVIAGQLYQEGVAASLSARSGFSAGEVQTGCWLTDGTGPPRPGGDHITIYGGSQ